MSQKYFLDTEMTWVVFSISAIEIIMFAIQLVYYLQRTSDKKRLWYLLLLSFIIHYNVISGFFPDEDVLWISVTMQNIWAYAAGIMMAAYFVMYWYLAFDLKDLKVIALYGPILFILLPFAAIFLIVYWITDDLELARKTLVVIPFIYGVGIMYLIYKSFMKKFAFASDSQEKRWQREEMLSVYLAAFFMVGLSILVYFGASQIVEQVTTNIGFLPMTYIYVRIQILRSKTEYRKMLEKEKEFYLLQEQIKAKDDKLAGNVITMERMNEFIQKFKETLGEVDWNDIQNFKKLESFEKEWDIIGEMKYLKVAYSDFFKKLDDKYPDLTEGERKYLLYLKIGLTNQEIAALKKTTMEALRSQRYRIRKKMNLVETLDEFIKKME